MADAPKERRSAATVRGSTAIRQNSAQPSALVLQHQPRQRDQDDQAQIGQGKAERQPETREDARLLEHKTRRAAAHARRNAHAGRLLCRLIDLVEDAAVVEMGRLRLCPAAENRVVDGDELQLGEALQILRIGRLGLRRAVVVRGDDLLRRRRCRGIRDRPAPPRACPWRRHCRRPARPAAPP